MNSKISLVINITSVSKEANDRYCKHWSLCFLCISQVTLLCVCPTNQTMPSAAKTKQKKRPKRKRERSNTYVTTATEDLEISLATKIMLVRTVRNDPYGGKLTLAGVTFSPLSLPPDNEVCLKAEADTKEEEEKEYRCSRCKKEFSNSFGYKYHVGTKK